MSHFNRWWSKQRIEDKEAKRFSHTVWNESAKPYQVTIDKLTAELAEMREEYGHKCAKCGSVLQLVRPGKHQCQYCEMESALTAELAAEKKFSQDRIDDIEELHLELARYKQGVEVRDFVNHYGILENEFELHSHLRDKRVRVLVMKDEVGG